MLAVNQIGAFYPAEDREFFTYFLQDLRINIYDTVTELTASACDKKIMLLHFPYPYNNNVEKIIEQHNDDRLLFYIVITELHTDASNFIKRFDRKNIVYFVNGQLNFKLEYSLAHTFLDWFETTKQYYTLGQFQSEFYNKPYFFDALLGRNKPHRKIVNDYIEQHLEEQVYLKFNHDRCNFDFTSAAWDPGVDNLILTPGTSHTVEFASYQGKNVRISQLIPENIYNQTYYSLVAETHCQNDVVFLTEKTVKPIIAKRLFILIGNQHSLKFLKSLGFQTFDGIIDESYDSAESVADRINLALTQVEHLCKQCPSRIINEIAPIVEHNHQLMMSNNWREQFRTVLVN